LLLKDVNIEEAKTRRNETLVKLGVAATVEQDLVLMKTMFDAGGTSPNTEEVSHEAQKQIAGFLSGLPASVQAQFAVGAYGKRLLGTVKRGHATTMSQFGRTFAAGGYAVWIDENSPDCASKPVHPTVSTVEDY
jgi:hypothetical protein